MSEVLLRFRYALNATEMLTKQKQKTFHLNAIIGGHIVSGKVAFSPAPEPGIFTELARFEAQRILSQMVEEEIAAGRL